MSARTIVRVAAAVICSAAMAACCWRSACPATPTQATGNFPAASSSPANRRATRCCASSHEELGIVVTRAAPWLTQRFDYPHAHVELAFLPRVRMATASRIGHDGQAIAWQTPGRDRRDAAAAGQRAGAARARLAGRVCDLDGRGPGRGGISRARARRARRRARADSAAREIVRAGTPARACRQAAGDQRAVRRARAAQRRRGHRARARLRRRALERGAPARGALAPARHAVRRVDATTRPSSRSAAQLGVDFVVLGPVLPTRRRIRTRARWAGSVSPSSLPARRCRCTRSADSAPRRSRHRDRARRARRRAAPRRVAGASGQVR